MKHADHLGHAISTGGHAVGHCWRGYYRVDDGMFQAVVRLAQSEVLAHITARIRAEQAINQMETSRAAARPNVKPSPARPRSPRRASGG